MRTIDLPLAEQSRLRVRADLAAIRLFPVSEGQPSRIEVADDFSAEIRVEEADGLIDVWIGSDPSGAGWFSGWRERAVSMFVPATVEVTVKSDAGEIVAERLGPARFTFKTSAGRIALESIRGVIHAHSDAGQIRGEDLAGSFELSTDAGQIRCQIRSMDPGEHQFTTQAGQVRLILGPEIRARFDTRTQLGSCKVKVESDPSSDVLIRASTEIGSIRITRAGDSDELDREQRRAERHEHRFSYRYQTGADVPTPPTPPVPPVPPIPPTPPVRVRISNEDFPVSVGVPPASRQSEVSRVLTMIEAGTITAAEGLELLNALRDS
jgi:hypothetical protein